MTLPPWSIDGAGRAASAKQIAAMKAWTNAQLDQLQVSDFIVQQNRLSSDPDHKAEMLDWYKNLGPQIEAARNGDIAPLKKLFPLLAEFLVAPPPPRKRRQATVSKSSPKQPEAQPYSVRAAWEDVKRIRKIWKQHYGRTNRRRDDPISAELIAACRWGVSVEDILKLNKPGGKRR